MPADRFFHPRLQSSVKVSALTDFEFRVWTAYELTADDYGVMRFSGLTLQAANDSLAKRPAAKVQAALEKLVEVGLIHRFMHQGREYVYQRDWQNWQRVKHPRDTMQPIPPTTELQRCSPSTRKLFSQHNSLRRPEGDESPENGKSPSGDCPAVGKPLGNEQPPNGSLACARERETANGLRLTANGSLGERSGEGADVLPPYDRWFRELRDAYPAQARSSGPLAEGAFIDQFAEIRGPTPLVDAGELFGRMLANLENQKRGYQWRVKRMIPRLDKWLRDGLWQQQHDEQAPVAEQLTPKTNRTLQAAADIMREDQ